jgi:hypothetical protein
MYRLLAVSIADATYELKRKETKQGKDVRPI